MAKHTRIEWCDHTFNIAWGCVKVSPGCTNCYAKTVAERFGFAVWGPNAPRRRMGFSYWHQPVRWNREAARDGVRRRVFCSSMADVFEDHPTIVKERAKLWPLIKATPHLDWLVLTKRPEAITRAALPDDWGHGYPNVWLGTSVESAAYEVRVELLLQVPAVLHFLSCEPLLGPLSPTWPSEGYAWTGRRQRLRWVIVGGESGPRARPCNPEWLRALRDDCATRGIPFLLKQLGGHPDKRGHEAALLDGVRHLAWPRPSATESLEGSDGF